MSYENPTQLRIGMHGDFAGKDFRLVGRSVLGVDINGETYYWNEFNLEAKTGEIATLVYEDTERGGEWRLFTEFEPEYPLTAADAATKQVGDQLNLTGTDVHVTLVQTSRVYRVEGRGPEGEKVGSVANYFNAEAGDVMQVVSWTGDEVEYYNGVTLSRGAVEKAFNIPRAAAPARTFSGLGSSSWSDSGSGEYLSTGKFVFWAVIIGFVFCMFFATDLSCFTRREAAPVKRISAAPPPLMVGMSGTLEGKNYKIAAHAVVEIGEVGTIYERNEYELTDDYGVITLLVCGEKPGIQDWTIYTPLTPFQPPSTHECAAQKVGNMVTIDGNTGTVHDLFQSTIKHTENVAPSGWHQGDVQYGYAAGTEYNSLLVRWDNHSSSFLHGRNLPAKRVTDAFSVTNGL